MTINKARCLPSRCKLEQKRLRLRDWLEMRIDSPDYPGLEWVHREQKIFRIPWKHGARHGWREAIDARLFQEWSEHTGSSPRDVKQHKANFRCALNSLRDIVQVHKMNKQKGEDAYRVYQMLPKKNLKPTKEWIKKRNPKLPTYGRKDGRLSSTSSDQLISPCDIDPMKQFPPHTQEVFETVTFPSLSTSHQGAYSTSSYSDCCNKISQPSTTSFQTLNDCFSLPSFCSDYRSIPTPGGVLENLTPAIENQHRADSRVWEDAYSQSTDMDASHQEVFVFPENSETLYEQSFHPTTSPACSNNSDWDSNFYFFEDGNYSSSSITQQASSPNYKSFWTNSEQTAGGSLPPTLPNGSTTDYISPAEPLLCLNRDNDGQCFEEPLMSSSPCLYVDDKSYLDKSFSNFQNVSMSLPEDANRQLLSEGKREQYLLEPNSASIGRLPSASTLLSS